MAARDAAAKQARASGDKELAAAIKALRRPSVAAWYVNLAARGSLVSLREWLALGASLREAQSALDMARVRSLGAGRAALEDRVIRDLTAHLATLGVTATAPALEEVRTTLRAALADANAAERVAAGRLDRALTYGGFGEVDVSAALAAMAASRPEPDTGPEPAAEPDAEPETEPEPEPQEEPEPPPAPERGPDPALVAAAEAARERLDRATAALAVAQRELREAQARLADAEGEVIASGKAHREAEAALGG